VLRDRLQRAELIGDAISTEAIVRAIADEVRPSGPDAKDAA
jgi:hypothetical protein